MNGKDRAEISKNSKKAEIKQQPAFKHVVSEGSLVVLDVRDLIKDGDTTNSIKDYSWKYPTDIHLIIDDSVKDNSIISFTAPFVKGSNPNTSLSIELTVTDKDGKTRNAPYNANVIVKRVHRAIIFQAGVALGAYEAGVFQALVKKISEEDFKRGLENKRPLFDIVAGASIGALNAAVVVSNAIKSKSWQHSADKLVRFWRYQQYPIPTMADILDINPIYRWWWDITHITNEASKSSASTVIEFIPNVNPYLKNWYDLFMGPFSPEPDFWKDFFIDGWYIPATGEAAT
jgi:patatin-like phospholipase